MKEKNFQLAVKYGSIALLICVIVNVWIVMRHVEIYRDAARIDGQMQQLLFQQQALQGVLQEFAVRAATDPTVAEILRRAEAASVPATALPAGATP